MVSQLNYVCEFHLSQKDIPLAYMSLLASSRIKTTSLAQYLEFLTFLCCVIAIINRIVCFLFPFIVAIIFF